MQTLLFGSQQPKFKIGDTVARINRTTGEAYNEKLYVEDFEAINGQWHYFLFFDKECKTKFCSRTNECVLIKVADGENI